MKTIEIIESGRQHEDTYDAIHYDIVLDDIVIGWASVNDGEDGTSYVERIDIEESHRNHGHGSAALEQLSDIFGGVIIAPDNEDAQRLYERLGRKYRGEIADYLDQGFGVYTI